MKNRFFLVKKLQIQVIVFIIILTIEQMRYKNITIEYNLEIFFIRIFFTPFILRMF